MSCPRSFPQETERILWGSNPGWKYEPFPKWQFIFRLFQTLEFADNNFKLFEWNTVKSGIKHHSINQIVWKWQKALLTSRKHWKKVKVLINLTPFSPFGFLFPVFKGLELQTCKNKGFFGKLEGLNGVKFKALGKKMFFYLVAQFCWQIFFGMQKVNDDPVLA